MSVLLPSPAQTFLHSQDPTETSVDQSFAAQSIVRSFPKKRAIVSPLHGHGPCGKVTWQSPSEAATSHCHAWRRSRLAGRRARTAIIARHKGASLPRGSNVIANHCVRLAITLAVVFFLAPSAWSQPARTIKIVVPYTPGSWPRHPLAPDGGADRSRPGPHRGGRKPPRRRHGNRHRSGRAR